MNQIQFPSNFYKHRQSTILSNFVNTISLWDMGTNPDKLKELCQYWTDEYDQFTDQDYLNSFNQYKYNVDDLKLHFVFEKGKGKNNYPLVLLHGWPGSVSEFHNIIPMLTENSSNISFDVIVPSLPGFGFSDKPYEPIGPRKMANYINKLLVDVLGYKNYFAQGGDWGSYIAAWLAFDNFKNCKGIHLNMMGFRHINGTQNEEEKKWEDDFEFNNQIRIEKNDPYFEQISNSWGESLKKSIKELPPFDFK